MKLGCIDTKPEIGLVPRKVGCQMQENYTAGGRFFIRNDILRLRDILSARDDAGGGYAAPSAMVSIIALGGRVSVGDRIEEKTGDMGREADTLLSVLCCEFCRAIGGRIACACCRGCSLLDAGSSDGG